MQETVRLTQVEERCGLLWVRLHDFTVKFDCFLVRVFGFWLSLQRRVSHAEIEMRFSEIWIETNRLLESRDGLLVLIVLVKLLAPFEQRLRLALRLLGTRLVTGRLGSDIALRAFI